MLAEGEVIPSSSGFDRVRADPEFCGGYAVLVPLKADALVQRVQVTLPAPVLRRIDEHVEQWGQSRSSFLTEAAKHELARDAGGVAVSKRRMGVLTRGRAAKAKHKRRR
jgi:HicB_like antitoxin of bacterial toxin-antitoxin system